MQSRLLPLLKNLHTKPSPLAGLWLMHSDEPLLQDWLIEACRPIWTNNNQLIKRLELISVKSWQEVVNELSSLNLFDEHTALIITGTHKPDIKDKVLMQTLTDFAQKSQTGANQNHLLWLLPKQDKKALASKALQFFASNGHIIDGNIYDEKLRYDFLSFKAKQLSLSLDDDAWQMLMNSTEGNLLTAYQTLWRLSFLPHQDIFNTTHLQEALVAGADFNVFDLSDTLLNGNTIKALQILKHLQHTNTAPSLVLWVLAKEARLILQIQAGKNPAELGIWQNKVHLYTQCAQRTLGKSGNWSNQIYTIDKSIKGVSNDEPWGELQRLCLSLCGVWQITI